MNGRLTSVLEANGFRQISSSSARLRFNQGSVETTRWEKADDYGKVATVEVRQVADCPEFGTLQPGTRLACAAICSAEELQQALDYHGIEIIIGIPQKKKGGEHGKGKA